MPAFPSSSALDVSNTNLLTISAWVRPDVFIPGNNQAIFVHTSSGTNQQYALTINGDGRLYFITAGSNGSPGSFEDGPGNVGNGILTLNQWSHVSMTYDGSAVRFYINGDLDFEHYIVDNFHIEIFLFTSEIYPISTFLY